jgi:glycerol-1-phosphate dehydrogenase [NAD(P)+]
MTSWFSLLQQTLNSEGLEHHSLVPQQHWCPTLETLSEAFSQWYVSLNNPFPIFVFVDGHQKDCDGSTIDERFLEILRSKKIAFAWKDVADICEVNKDCLHASFEHISKIKTIFSTENASAIVVLGSGTVTDLVKHALFESGMPTPLVTVPTAISVTAYTSAFSVLDYGGAKRTKNSAPVSTVFWTYDFVSRAPIAMSRAGYGDLLAPFFAYADWWLAHRLGLTDNYSEASHRLLEPFFEGIKQSASGLSSFPLSQSTTECLCATLGMAGIGMNIAGETAPFSGLEHAVSHGLDYIRMTSDRPLVLHGEQVALSCLASAAIYDWIIEQPKPDVRKWRRETEDSSKKVLMQILADAPYWGEAEKSLSSEEREKKLLQIEQCIHCAEMEFSKDYAAKHAKWSALLPLRKEIAENWQEIMNNLRSRTIRSHELESLMAQARLPLSPEHTTPTTAAIEFRWALRFAPFVRARASVADLLFWMGEDPAIIAGI